MNHLRRKTGNVFLGALFAVVMFVIASGAPLADFGDAPDNRTAYRIEGGTNIQGLYPTLLDSANGQKLYNIHRDPSKGAFLGLGYDLEENACEVDCDTDDLFQSLKLAERQLPTLSDCKLQDIPVTVTLPKTLPKDFKLYLNFFADWTQNGVWLGEDFRCGFATAEWVVKNFEIHEAFPTLEPGRSYVLPIPALVGRGGNFWTRFDLCSAPMASNSIGQNDCPDGEVEDWAISVITGAPIRQVELKDQGPSCTADCDHGGGGGGGGSGGGGSGGGGNGGNGKDKEKGNNGVGNGLDPQPPGNPPCNDCAGTGPGNPGNQGGSGNGNSGNGGGGSGGNNGGNGNGGNGGGNGNGGGGNGGGGNGNGGGKK